MTEVEDFISSARNANTRHAYRNDLRDFSSFIGFDLVDVKRADVDRYVQYMERLGRAPNTVARRLSVLSQFYKYCWQEDLISKSPIVHIKRPRLQTDETTILGLDRDEARCLIDTARDMGPNEHALVCLLLLNGLRVSEACRARVEDLGRDRGYRTLRVTRKGGKVSVVPLCGRASDAIDAALGGRKNGVILRAQSGKEGMLRMNAAYILRRIVSTCGLEKKITPHSLRHTFVTLSLDAGASLRDVQDAAGHTDPRTTRMYDRARGALDRHPTHLVEAFLS